MTSRGAQYRAKCPLAVQSELGALRTTKCMILREKGPLSYVVKEMTASSSSSNRPAVEVIGGQQPTPNSNNNTLPIQVVEREVSNRLSTSGGQGVGVMPASSSYASPPTTTTTTTQRAQAPYNNTSPSPTFNVTIGSSVRCSCSSSTSDEPVCRHVLFLLTRVFRLPLSNPMLWQASLTDSEIELLLRGKRRYQSGRKGGKDEDEDDDFWNAPISSTSEDGDDESLPNQGNGTHPDGDSEQEGAISIKPPPQQPLDPNERMVASDDDCPICCELLVEDDDNGAGRQPPVSYAEKGLVFCRHGCGNHIHRTCFAEFAKHHLTTSKAPLQCPMCRAQWGSVADMFEVIDGNGNTTSNSSAQNPSSHHHRGGGYDSDQQDRGGGSRIMDVRERMRRQWQMRLRQLTGGGVDGCPLFKCNACRQAIPANKPAYQCAHCGGEGAAPQATTVTSQQEGGGYYLCGECYSGGGGTGSATSSVVHREHPFNVSPHVVPLIHNLSLLYGSDLIPMCRRFNDAGKIRERVIPTALSQQPKGATSSSASSRHSSTLLAARQAAAAASTTTNKQPLSDLIAAFQQRSGGALPPPSPLFPEATITTQQLSPPSGYEEALSFIGQPTSQHNGHDVGAATTPGGGSSSVVVVVSQEDIERHVVIMPASEHYRQHPTNNGNEEPPSASSCPSVNSCNICSERIVVTAGEGVGEDEEEDMVGVLPRCKHAYHYVCLKRWLSHYSSLCPLDGKHLLSPELDEQQHPSATTVTKATTTVLPTRYVSKHTPAPSSSLVKKQQPHPSRQHTTTVSRGHRHPPTSSNDDPPLSLSVMGCGITSSSNLVAEGATTSHPHHQHRPPKRPVPEGGGVSVSLPQQEVPVVRGDSGRRRGGSSSLAITTTSTSIRGIPHIHHQRNGMVAQPPPPPNTTTASIHQQQQQRPLTDLVEQMSLGSGGGGSGRVIVSSDLGVGRNQRGSSGIGGAQAVTGRRQLRPSPHSASRTTPSIDMSPTSIATPQLSAAGSAMNVIRRGSVGGGGGGGGGVRR